MNNCYGFSQAARIIIIGCLLFAGDWLVEARGGRGGGGRGSSGSRGSSSGRGWFGGSSKSSSSSSYGSSYRSSGSSYSSSYGSSGRNWFDRYSGNTIVVMRPHTYYGGGSSVYSSHDPDSPIYGGQNTLEMESERQLVTVAMIKDVLIPWKDRSKNLRRPSKKIFDYEENPYRLIERDSDDVLENLRRLGDGDSVKKLMNEFLERTTLLMNYGEKTEEEQKKEKLMRASEEDEQVLIKDEKKAVIVGPMTYFFGDRNLPRTEVAMLRNTINGKSPLANHYPRASDTVTFKSTNNDSMIVYGVAALTRCSKSLDEVVSLGRRQGYGMMTRPQSDVEKVIINDKQGVIKELAWFCPQSIKCCEWECCTTVEKPHNEFDPPDEDFVGSVHLVAFCLFIIASTFICFHCCKNKKEEEITADPTRYREQSVEMVPLVVPEYPKQLRSNPAFPPLREPEPQPSAPETNGGPKIGWTVKPFAPSAPRDFED